MHLIMSGASRQYNYFYNGASIRVMLGISWINLGIE